MSRLAVRGFNRDVLMRLRRAADLTQEDLAILIGVSATSISSWEVGRSAPDPANFAKLSRALGDDAGELIDEVDPLHGLAEHRARAGLSQAQAASDAAIPLRALRHIERGVRLPTREERAALAKAYAITEDEVTRLSVNLHNHRKGRST